MVEMELDAKDTEEHIDDDDDPKADAVCETSPSPDEELVANGDASVTAGDLKKDVDEDEDEELEEMVAWTDVDEEEDEGDNPIRSKNELQALPPVPWNRAIKKLLPIGIVLSIVGTQVIVEGMEEHNPLHDSRALFYG